MKTPGPDHPITVAPAGRHVRVVFNGRVVADTTRALELREASLPPVHYIPRSDVNMALLARTDHGTHCPYKGDAAHHSLKDAPGYEDILWHYEAPVSGCPDISGHASFYWHEVDRWFEEDEEVFVHARDPFKRVDTLPTARRVTVEAGGRALADSARAVLLFETGLPTRPYVPLQDCDDDLLIPSDHRTQCPYKGEAQYFHVDLPQGRLENAAWYYADPVHEAARIRGLVCFAGEHVDRIAIGGRDEPRPVTAFARGYNYHGYKD